jgi:DNA-binding NarL/FixJ family response regulator
MRRPIRLLVAERTPTRIGVRIALQGEVEICAEADTIAQAIRAAKECQPDVCLIGLGLGGDGLAAIRGVCRAAPEAGVIALADACNAEDMLEAIRAGAVGYVPGGISAERLRKIVMAVDAREAVLPRALVLDLMLELRTVGGVDGLTGRETQVLGMLRRGQSTAAIAERLGIAPVTVRRHVSELVRKLGVANRSALVERASGRPAEPSEQAA